MKKYLYLALLLISPIVKAQKPALVTPVIRFQDNNGKPLVGGFLYSYQAGTTTPLPTYVDSTTSALNTNPVVLDSTGSATVFLGASVYKFVLENSSHVVQWTADNITQSGAGLVLEVNGTPISPASPGNFADTASVTWSFTGGQIKATAAGSGGGCSSGGIATTNGLVTGDTTSTNCGLNNRTSDTATPPANVSTFGKANGAANSGTEAVMVGDTNGTNNAAVDVLFAGDTNGQYILSGNDWVGLGDFTFFGDATHTFTGQNNVAIGDQASATGTATGSHSLTDTVDIGDTAGLDTSGADYIYIGDSVGVHNLTGQDIVGIGNTAVANTVSGTDIVGVGNADAANIGTGSNDVVGVGDGSSSSLGAGVSDIVGIGDGASTHLGDASSSVVGIGLGAANEVSGQVVTNIVGIGQEVANKLGTASHDIIGIGNNGCTQLGVSSDDICIGDNVNAGSGTALVNSIGIGHGVTMVSNTTSIGNSSIASLILFGCPSGEAVLDDGSGTCFTPGGGGGGVDIKTNSSDNSSQSLLNMETSTANSVGLTITPSNPSGGIEKWEITGSSYTGNAATATALASAPSTCVSANEFSQGVGTNGNAICNTHLTDASGILTYSGGGSYNAMQPGTNIFSALPTCDSGLEGAIAPVTDSTTNTWGATIAGSGSDHVMAYCDGTNWTVGAK